MSLTQPPCPNCQTDMVLPRHQPSSDGRDRRVFECPNCKELLQFVIAADDPMERAGGYLSSDLKPPE